MRGKSDISGMCRLLIPETEEFATEGIPVIQGRNYFGWARAALRRRRRGIAAVNASLRGKCGNS